MTNLAEIKNSENPDIKFDNRYRLKEKIGGGGFSEVWLAHDTNADIDVALKIYTPNGGKRIHDASIYTSKKISLKFLFLSDIFLFPFIRQQFPVLT